LSYFQEKFSGLDRKEGVRGDFKKDYKGNKALENRSKTLRRTPTVHLHYTAMLQRQSHARPDYRDTATEVSLTGFFREKIEFNLPPQTPLGED